MPPHNLYINDSNMASQRDQDWLNMHTRAGTNVTVLSTASLAEDNGGLNSLLLALEPEPL